MLRCGRTRRSLSKRPSSMSSKKVPVVIYNKDGERKEVGEAAVTQQGDHFFISAKVTDPEVAKIFEIDPKELSIGRKPTIVNPRRIPREIQMISPHLLEYEDES